MGKKQQMNVKYVRNPQKVSAMDLSMVQQFLIFGEALNVDFRGILIGLPIRIANVDKVFGQKTKYHFINKAIMATKHLI